MRFFSIFDLAQKLGVFACSFSLYEINTTSTLRRIYVQSEQHVDDV